MTAPFRLVYAVTVFLCVVVYGLIIPNPDPNYLYADLFIIGIVSVPIALFSYVAAFFIRFIIEVVKAAFTK